MSEVAPVRPVVLRPQIGLMLSIGEPPTDTRNYPKKLDHFRPKPGTEGQFAPAVVKFHEKYGDAPKVLDIILLSNEIGDVLDIRYKAFGLSGLKAIGATNFADCPDRIGGPDKITAFPENSPGVREGEITDDQDPRAEKLGLKTYCDFRFALEGVTGLTTLASITTTSRRSMLNLVSGITQVTTLTGGQLGGIPFQLAVRPARTRFFDEAKGKRSTSTFYELVFQAPGSIDDFFEQARVRRAQMNAGRLSPELFDGPERRALNAASDLPVDEPVETRDEPATVDRPTGAQLNRVAILEEQAGDAALLLLRGVFGVDTAGELSRGDMARYEEMLDRAAADDAEEFVIEDPGPEADAAVTAAALTASGEAQDTAHDVPAGPGQTSLPLPDEIRRRMEQGQ